MPSPNSIQAQGTVTEVLEDGAYRVELANGHRCFAHVGREFRLESSLAPGDKISLEFHPYDLSRARITG